MAGNAPRTLLLAVAAPAEARAVLRGLGADETFADQPWKAREGGGDIDVVISGVGKVNAAGALARCLSPERHRAVLSVGVAGALPGSGLGLRSSVAATACVYADEGLLTPAGFTDCGAM